MRKILLVIAIFSLVLVSGCIGQSPIQQTNSLQKISALAKPGIVLIVTNITGIVTLPSPFLAADGNLIPSESIYIRNVGMLATGSGFIISQDGYIVTNAHVVNLEDSLVAGQLLESASQGELNDFAAVSGREPTNDEIELIVNYVYSYGNVSGARTESSVIMGVSTGNERSFVQYLAVVKKAGEPAPGKDVAIIKIDASNMPTVRLGDSDIVQVGDKIYPMGYPFAATFHPYLSEDSMTEPSVTSGIISAEKHMRSAYTAFQTDASITHGSSGGPVFNEHGDVIGIATFGSMDFNTGQEIAGFNFILPINLAKEFMRDISVKNTQGPADMHYSAAMDAYWSKDYSKANSELDAVLNIYPSHPYAAEFIKKIQNIENSNSTIE